MHGCKNGRDVECTYAYVGFLLSAVFGTTKTKIIYLVSYFIINKKYKYQFNTYLYVFSSR